MSMRVYVMTLTLWACLLMSTTEARRSVRLNPNRNISTVLSCALRSSRCKFLPWGEWSSCSRLDCHVTIRVWVCVLRNACLGVFSPPSYFFILYLHRVNLTFFATVKIVLGYRPRIIIVENNKYII